MSTHSHGHGHGHDHHAPQTGREKRAGQPARPGLWPLWIYLGLFAVFAISMTADDHGKALADLILMVMWVVAYILVVWSIVMIPICFTDKDKDGKRDMRGVVTYLIALVLSLAVALFVAGPLRVR